MDGLDRVWSVMTLFVAIVSFCLAFANIHRSPYDVALRLGAGFAALAVAFGREGVEARQERSAVSLASLFAAGSALGCFACAAVLSARS